jgi:HK97 family phage portal protein
MGLFDWLRPQVVKESRAGRVIFEATRKAQWSKREYKAFADEAYVKNVIAHQAIQRIAKAVGAAAWYAKRPNGDELETHPFLDLVQNPNPMQSGPQFMQALVGFYMISGNAYIERTMAGGTPRELFIQRSDRMNVLASETGMPRGYEYRIGNHIIRWDADPKTGESDIRHLKAFNPVDDWYGLSPVQAGAYGVDQHNEAMAWMQGLLQNSAAPSGVIQAEGDLGDDQYNRLKSEIDEKYTGGRNAGRPLLLEGGMSWTPMGMSPQQMQIIEAKHSAARDVSLAFGVPPLLLNIPGDSTYANYSEARLAFYEETVIPLMLEIRDELNAWLSPRFGGVELDIDLDQIPAIAEKRHQLWEMADRSPDLTINERRAMKGYDEIPGGDVVMVSSSMIPLGMAQEPIDFGDESGTPEQIRMMKALAYGPSKTD